MEHGGRKEGLARILLLVLRFLGHGHGSGRGKMDARLQIQVAASVEESRIWLGCTGEVNDVCDLTRKNRVGIVGVDFF